MTTPIKIREDKNGELMIIVYKDDLDQDYLSVQIYNDGHHLSHSICMKAKTYDLRDVEPMISTARISREYIRYMGLTLLFTIIPVLLALLANYLNNG